MLFSGGLVPSYIINTRYLHLNNTVWIFLLPSLASAYNVIILRTFILSTIPDSLFEAARIDGAGHFRVFISVVLPLFKAGLATIGLFNVVSALERLVHRHALHHQQRQLDPAADAVAEDTVEH